ncbi:MAG: TIGR03560 family F420-dependent LLM class oxidoreductase [Chloroflexi bacterium]|nr:TIGR03560 family F420-dependent LLM class oxidoreductase [Chloroflexota bacterium]
MNKPLRVGLKLIQQTHPIEVQREVWRIADEAGFDQMWAFDHFYALGDDPAQPIFDGWSCLAAMAVVTKRIRIGLNVTGNLYRHPGVLAKIATTVDHLSGGRLEFGIGAAWSEPEFRMLGMPFPQAPADRIRMLDEACTVIKALWTEHRASFAGRYYTLTEAIAEPKPVQRPHPPIHIGGSGPKRTLRVAAKHAAVWNGFGRTTETYRELNRILDEHCATVGRDPDTLGRSLAFSTDLGAEKLVRESEAYLKAGATELIVTVRTADARKGAEMAAREVLPRLRSLG